MHRQARYHSMNLFFPEPILGEDMVQISVDCIGPIADTVSLIDQVVSWHAESHLHSRAQTQRACGEPKRASAQAVEGHWGNGPVETRQNKKRQNE